MKPHAYLNDGLLLRREVLFYILLQSSQHHGLQNALKFLNLRHPKTQFLCLSLGDQWKNQWDENKLHSTKNKLSPYLFFSLKVSKLSHKCLLRREAFRLQEVK